MQLPVLETRRLILRPFTLADAADVQRLAGDWADADTTLNVPHPYEDGMAESWIASHQPRFRAKELAALAVTLRDDGGLLGAVSLRLDDATGTAALGYWIGKSFWILGYCTEAAAAIVEYGFGTLGLQRINGLHLARNPASGRVMQKLGMLPDASASLEVEKHGRLEAVAGYSVPSESWPQARSRLIGITDQKRLER